MPKKYDGDITNSNDASVNSNRIFYFNLFACPTGVEQRQDWSTPGCFTAGKKIIYEKLYCDEVAVKGNSYLQHSGRCALARGSATCPALQLKEAYK